MSKLDNLLAEEGAAAESYEIPEELPGHVRVGRPNLGRGTVVSVRLSAEEHGHLQRAAEEANLPVSTLIRIWALDRLRAEREGAGGTVAERLARLEREVFQQRTA
ncbi:MAG: CopG family transcriptional regulator [Actinomycetota bacterium]|nr:CopG family transcriptional regulator [Actinomycetota bacterium]